MNEKYEEGENRMTRYEIEVQGMSCGHCVARVEGALKPLSSEVNVDLEAKLATGETDKNLDDLLSALEEAGYPGTVRA